ncbi:hypothetical protein [Melissospora conviva]|uniref:hypothetical protein n=1 Tax=Melissospora conviva TaxID=3388432 RepID=UPI003B75D525
MEQAETVLIVDAANVVGSRPDGWWRDRAGATARLRDRLTGIAAGGLAEVVPPVRVVLVVEGAARDIPAVPGVEVVAAPGSGDDTIVEVVRAHPGRRRVVVTADRLLCARVAAEDAEVRGPRWLTGATGHD